MNIKKIFKNWLEFVCSLAISFAKELSFEWKETRWVLRIISLVTLYPIIVLFMIGTLVLGTLLWYPINEIVLSVKEMLKNNEK